LKERLFDVRKSVNELIDDVENRDLIAPYMQSVNCVFHPHFLAFLGDLKIKDEIRR
jgi:hypothetical protein